MSSQNFGQCQMQGVVKIGANVLAVGAVRLLTIKLNKMTELQRQFMEETGVSFDGIPINGVHLEYITWLEAQIQALRQPPVSGSLLVKDLLEQHKIRVDLEDGGHLPGWAISMIERWRNDS